MFTDIIAPVNQRNLFVNAAILNDLGFPALVIGANIVTADFKLLSGLLKYHAHSPSKNMLLDSLGSPWYAGPRLSRRFSIAQI